MNEPSASQRLFFALWPGAEVQAALAEAGAAALGRRKARRVAADKLHITLAFLGEVDDRTQACAESVAASLAGRAFDLSLDQLGYWGRRGLLWAGPAATPPALSALVADLGAGLEQCGLPQDQRPFRPHVTLARKAPRLPSHQPIPAIHWPVRRFVLVASRLTPQGAVYPPVGEWSLEEDGPSNPT